jgi:flagellar basal body rod protein FlgF
MRLLEGMIESGCQGNISWFENRQEKIVELMLRAIAKLSTAMKEKLDKDDTTFTMPEGDLNESKKTNDNKLQYMRGMESWINDTENLDSMIERSLKSTEFQNLINNRLPDEPKRQVKIY